MLPARWALRYDSRYQLSLWYSFLPGRQLPQRLPDMEFFYTPSLLFAVVNLRPSHSVAFWYDQWTDDWWAFLNAAPSEVQRSYHHDTIRQNCSREGVEPFNTNLKPGRFKTDMESGLESKMGPFWSKMAPLFLEFRELIEGEWYCKVGKTTDMTAGFCNGVKYSCNWTEENISMAWQETLLTLTSMSPKSSSLSIPPMGFSASLETQGPP